MMITLATGLVSVAPSLLLVWFFHARDRFPEPPRVIWTTFLLGLLTIPPVVAFEWLITSAMPEGATGLEASLFDAFLVAALVEETFKLLVLLFYSFRRPAFDETMDGMVYGAVASLGFATLENVLYVLEGGMGVGITRALLSVPAHACWGALLGYHVARGRLRGRPLQGILAGLSIAVLLHGLYDFPIIHLERVDDESGAALLILATLAAAIASWVWVLRISRKMRRAQQECRTAHRASDSGIQPPARTGRPPSKAVAALLLVAGVVIASSGALLVLGIVIGFATGSVEHGDELPTLAGGFVIGVIPLVIGILLFRSGIRRLNRS